jgi:hypothetical protein
MLTAQFATVLPDVRIIAVSPGFAATDLNGHRGTDTPEEGVRAVVAAVTGEIAVPTGGFANITGVIDW